MNYNRSQALELNNALSQKGLKAKHISGENYIKLLNLKTTLKNELNKVGEGEQQLAEEFGATLTQNGFEFALDEKEKASAFRKKITEFQKAFSIELELNFIPENELKEYTKDQDTVVEAVLFEYLLKKKE